MKRKITAILLTGTMIMSMMAGMTVCAEEMPEETLQETAEDVQETAEDVQETAEDAQETAEEDTEEILEEAAQEVDSLVDSLTPLLGVDEEDAEELKNYARDLLTEDGPVAGLLESDASIAQLARELLAFLRDKQGDLGGLISALLEKLQEKGEELSTLVTGIIADLKERGIDLSDTVKGFLAGFLNEDGSLNLDVPKDLPLSFTGQGGENALDLENLLGEIFPMDEEAAAVS